MGTRYRKVFKVAPGVRMNLSGGGLSWTVGPRGASIGIGKRGTHVNAGLPGSGISYRQRISAAEHGDSRGGELRRVSIRVAVDDEGLLSFLDADGSPLSESSIAAAKKQHGGTLRELIQQKCSEINEGVEALGQLHWSTPSPLEHPKFVAERFPEPHPMRAPRRRIKFLESLIPAWRKKFEAEMESAEQEYLGSVRVWEELKADFESKQTDRKDLIERRILIDETAMGDFLSETLETIPWPRETTVSIDIADAGTIVGLNVDLPEIEDMPARTASVPQRGYRLSLKALSETKVRQLYSDHIHGIVFRLVGETMSALPRVSRVVVSGFTQRPDPGTGHEIDVYVISVSVERQQWELLNWNDLSTLDPEQALGRFDLRRKAARLSRLEAIEPIRLTS